MLELLLAALWSGFARLLRWVNRHQIQAGMIAAVVVVVSWAWSREWRPAYWVTSNRGRMIVHLWPADAAKLRGSPGVRSVEPVQPVTNRREARR
jgi:hypothetical protein